LNPGKQLWYCFGCGKGGDAVEFIKLIRGLGFRDAVEHLAGIVGVDLGGYTAGSSPPMPQPIPEQTIVPRPTPTEWEHILPVPADAPKPDFKHHKHGTPITTWAYEDVNGQLIGFIRRFDVGGKKLFFPLVWGKFRGKLGWRNKGFSKPLPLYGLESLKGNITKQIIIVEGEKTADAARLLFPKHLVMAWPGGTASAKNVDLAPLTGRSVLLISDNDMPGRRCMSSLADRLKLTAKTIKLILTDEKELPKGWDLADAQMTPAEAKDWVIDRLGRAAPPKPIVPPAVDLPVDPGPNSAQTDPFICLGYDHDTFFFFSIQALQLLSFSSSALTQSGHLLAIADLQWWETFFDPSPDKGNNQQLKGYKITAAANMLINRCRLAGIFNPDRTRGRGAWWERKKQRAVFHLGDHVVVNGESKTLLEMAKGEYLYEAAEPLPNRAKTPLSKHEANELAKLISMLHWEAEIHAIWLMGWIVTAVICGALEWRPHLWITASAGAGKSWVKDRIVSSILGPMALSVLSSTSEPGLRQTLKTDALPVIFDEAEQETESAKINMERILGLSRQASSESGGKLIKGSASGRAVSFSIRSAFLYMSIQVGTVLAADPSRITTINLKKNDTPEGKTHFREIIRPAAKKITGNDYPARFRARCIDLIPVVRENVKIFSETVADITGSQRTGDQLGTLAAGAYTLYSDSIVTQEHAVTWCGVHGLSAATHEEINDEEQLVNTIFAKILQVKTDKTTTEHNIAELINVAAMFPVDNNTLMYSTASDVLARNGIRVKPGETTFAIASHHPSLSAILKDTRWASGWRDALLRIDGAETSLKAVRFKGIVSRAVILPIAIAALRNQEKIKNGSEMLAYK